MGNCASSAAKVGYAELRESIPGSLVSEQDFDLFYSLCKVESARNISPILIPNQSPLFYVVISGEVHVHLAGAEMKNKSVVATIFTPGETIHFFNATLRTTHFPSVTAFDFGEILRSNGVKLALQFKSLPNATARVIGMDRGALEEFMVLASHNTHALTSFLGLSMADMVHKSPYLKTITSEQAAMFGILMKVRLSHIGGVISPVDSDFISCQSDSNSIKSPSERLQRSFHASQSFRTRCCTPVGPVSFMFNGTALVAPYGAPPQPLVQKIKLPHQTPKGAKTPKMFGKGSHGMGASTSKLLSPLNSFASFHKKIIQPPAIFSATQSRAEPELDKENDEFLRQYLTVGSGFLLGLGGLYCREPPMPPLTIVASSPCVIGYLNYAALDALFSVDARFNRVLQRNYFMQVMNWFKPTVPFLRDMDEWSFALLSCKIALKSFRPETVIYQRDSPSDFAYIIVGGAIKETIESNALKMSPTSASTTPGNNITIERILNAGTLFGEVALSTNNPYFSTVTAIEPTMVLCISKHVLEQIYNNNKTKLCEIRIRLLGGDAALQHVVDHPRGCKLFQAYLDKEMAGENLRFYTAVDRFDAMCSDVLKQYNQLWKAFQKYMQDVHFTSETLEGVLSVIYGSTEEHVTHDALSTENACVHDELESGKGSLDLHNNTFATSSFLVPNTVSTDGATRHSSFASEASEFSLQQFLPIDRYSVITNNTNNTNNTKSRNHSIDSDTFIQQFTQGGMHGAASFSDKDTSHDSSPYKATKNARKPVLESIVSESALALEESKKFSVKFKPSQHASLKNSQILPLTEDEHEYDEESAHVNAHTTTIAAKNLLAVDTTAEPQPKKNLDPDKAEEVARNLKQKLHRIQKNIVELKQVARSIVQTYIYNDSEYQLNLPGAVRTRTEEKFKAWATTLLASVTRDALANARADEGFHSLQPSIDRKNSFDFSDESARNGPKQGLYSSTNDISNDNNKTLTVSADVVERVEVSQNNTNHDAKVTGLRSVLSESSELTPASNINNIEHTPSGSHSYSDDFAHGAHVSNGGNNGIPVAVTMETGGTQVRKLSSVNSGFKASAPFISSFAPQGGANNSAVGFKPSPIKIPSNAYLSSTSTIASPIYTGDNLNHQARLPSEVTNNIATQVQALDMSFVSLFTESKQEILKLLRDDKFPRFKLTQEFNQFISAIKPYEHDTVTADNGYSYHFDNSLVHSLRKV